MASKSVRFSNSLSLFHLAGALILLAAGSTASAQTQDWTPIWSDNFSGPAGSAPNPNNWTLQQGLTPDGAQSYNCLKAGTSSAQGLFSFPCPSWNSMPSPPQAYRPQPEVRHAGR
jgi:hypothetical protein